MIVKLLTKRHLEFLSLKGGLYVGNLIPLHMYNEGLVSLHIRSLNSAFVIQSKQTRIAILSKCKISKILASLCS